MYSRKKIKIHLIPRSHFLLIGTLIVYYWNTLFGNSLIEKVAVILFILGILIGRFYSNIIPIFRVPNLSETRINNLLVTRLGLFIAGIGLFSHLLYYDLSVFQGIEYSENYINSRGKGYITVFFDWLPIGMLLTISASNRKNKWMIFVITVLLLSYCSFYFLILMKRRQVILVLICLVAIFLNKKINIKHVISMYLLAFGGYFIFSLFGRVREKFQSASFLETLSYIKDNFSIEWISLNNGFEGKYISMILSDTMGYVDANGLNISVLFGALTIIIPRSLLGFKFLAFPDWYTFIFHPYEHSLNIGYAGSIVAESYLYFSWAGILLFSIIIGYTSKVVDLLRERKHNIIYGVFIYICTILPRLDFGSLIIMILFTLLPIFLVYKASVIRN
ncbi:O-antigen polymerase [Neobacillus drentensis]|uniref:O-antigen polymerase n=1 Tax=Neobacillus drentensis TaxID=220684 RepID=UPI001F2E6ABB|nr:O-antigen polymerase [Neobacillus drentensis]